MGLFHRIGHSFGALGRFYGEQRLVTVAVLIIEDEAEVRSLVQATLERAGYRVIAAEDGPSGFRSFYEARPDLVLMDVRLPVMDGWALLDRMREVSEIPIIMLTALTTENDTVRGLKGGADDYISKPFRTAELLARCEAVLRRSSGPANRELVFEDAILKMDFQGLEVRLEGRPLALSPQEFRLLATLVRNADRVMSVAKLTETVWGSESGNRENLRMYISYLRKKLKDGSGRFNIIETIRGFGYRYRGSGG